MTNFYQYVPPSISLQAASYIAYANDYLQSVRDVYLEPHVLSPIRTMLSSPPDLFSVLILVFLFIISLKILDYTRRVIVFWVTFIFRLVFWSTIIGAGWYAYSVGLEKAARDAAWIFGLLEGFVQELLVANGRQEGREPASDFRRGPRR